MNAFIEQQKNKDTFSFNDAKTIVLKYEKHAVYSKFLPLMQTLVAAEDKKEFIITKTTVKARDGSIMQF